MPSPRSLPIWIVVLFWSALSCSRALGAAPTSPAAATTSTAAATVDVAPFDRERGLPFLTAFTPRDYRGHQQVMSLAEDSSGLLYAGNLDKVLIYDGARWTHLPVPGATFIRALAVDAEDTLWIGGVDELGYAKRDATGARAFVSLKDQLPAEARPCGTVWALALTPHGVLFQSAEWLLRWDGKRFTVLRLAPSPRWRLTVVGSEFWVTDPKHGWSRVVDDGATLRLEALPSPTGQPGPRAIGAFATGRADEFIVGTDREGLWRWDGQRFTPFATEFDSALRELQAYSMTRLADGRIVLCSIQNGVAILDAQGRLLTHLREEQGLPDTTASVALASRDPGVLWVGLGRGAARIDVRPWLSWFNPTNGTPRSKIFTATRAGSQLLLPAGFGGLARVVPAEAGRAARIERDPTLVGDVPGITVAYDSLILTGIGGITEITAQGERRPLPNAPASATSFFALRHNPDVWAALNSDEVRLYRRDATGWHTAGPVPGISRVRSLQEEDDGTWWLGRPAGGVLRAKFTHGYDAPPVVDTFVEPDGLPSGHGWIRLTRDSRGPLVLCNVGLLRFDAAANRFRTTNEYGADLADGTTYVYAATPDENAGLWFILRPANEAEAGNALRLAYGRAGQLTTLSIPPLSQIDDPGHLLHEPAKDGRPEALWISGHSAVVRLNLDLWRATGPAAPLDFQIRSVTTGHGRSLDLRGNWKLPATDRSIRVYFSAPALAGDLGATYESTLTSSSGQEVRTDQNPFRDLPALGAGDYTLSIRARSPGGVWSQPATLRFSVAPPWWRSVWAIGSYLTVVAFAVLALWKIRVRRWERRQRELESAVAARTSELAAQNAELHRLRQIEFDEKLAARLAEHKARLEVLRYQLNPHFLFNTLTSICAQIIQSPRIARETVLRLADFCRLTLHRPGETEAPTLGEEIEMLRAYLDIEQTRLGDLLNYEIHSEPSLHSLRLPPFLLLPLVENAVKYGAATSQDRVRIRLNFSRGPSGEVRIEVANSGSWIAPDARERSVPSLGIGLENLRQRLARYFPGRHEFTTERTDGWVVVRLSLQDPT